MPAGRPVKYKTTNQLRDRIEDYFTHATLNHKPYTVSGLCLFLDLTRETLCQYEKMDKFSDTIKRAKMRIENYIEEQSLLGNLEKTVSIFNLKNNFGWKDRQEFDHNGFIPVKIVDDLE